MCKIAALTLTTALLASSVNAATYSFTFSGTTEPGTVTGLIEGLSDDGLRQAATSVYVTSVTGSPFDFTPIYGFNFVPLPRLFQNSFDVVGGIIQRASFDSAIGNTSTDLLCFSTSGVICPSVIGYNGNQVIGARDTPDQTTFTRLSDEPSPVPLPAGAGLLASALALIGFFVRPGRHMRRRRPA